ncbi:Alcohol dehydrogenase, zinc-binding protein [Candidatus Koribacter versatilis Ellin345]|uniref:Alcohol dehydrogenase, zinc-binding protein n=1 Tax=Koribacter versatilis (strain Ellin345) TaxID=204669 RepID=Q1IVA3_KORVE|nr:NADPH:quinone oxidoreductase family protein [Candidatus Koribacter versatilis]ABF39197.1 Alcohol dehydrogenase, zinc-binding protein [Candidatus Koribacter versatilis Ellin345]
MKALLVEQLGKLESLALRDVPDPQVKPDRVVVNIEAAGVNFADISSSMGKYPGVKVPYIAGREFAGTVEGTGERVMGYTQMGAFAEKIAIPRAFIWPQPQGWTSVESAAFPVNFFTAYLVYWKAGLTADAFEPAAPSKSPRRALIHAVAGGVGTAAVQIGKLLGIETIGTSSSDEKLEKAKALGLTHGINYSHDDYQQRVMELTNGEGVDCVFEMLGGEHTKRSTRCTREFGRVILYGTATGERPEFDTLTMYSKSISVHGLWLSTLANNREVIAAAWIALKPWVEAGQLKPEVGHVMPMANASEAYKLMLNRKNYGKIILTV